MKVIHVARKPLIGTVAKNALAHGTGGLNIEKSRIGLVNEDRPLTTHNKGKHSAYPKRPAEDRVEVSGRKTPQNRPEFIGHERDGRWPANLILQHKPDCKQVDDAPECVTGCPVATLDEQSGVSKSTGGEPATGERNRHGIFGSSHYERSGVGVGKGDQGGASRFFKQISGESAEETP